MDLKATTICAVRNNGEGAIAGDGQVTMGETVIMKSTAKKVKRIFHDKVLMGFAGSVSDAFALAEMFEKKMEMYNGNLERAAVELAREWRNERIARKLEALLIVMDKDSLLIVSGTGEVVEPEDNVAAIGSGGNYALAAARALKRNNPEMSAAEIARQALEIASEICVYTNDNIIVEEITK